MSAGGPLKDPVKGAAVVMFVGLVALILIGGVAYALETTPLGPVFRSVGDAIRTAAQDVTT